MGDQNYWRFNCCSKKSKGFSSTRVARHSFICANLTVSVHIHGLPTNVPGAFVCATVRVRPTKKVVMLKIAEICGWQFNGSTHAVASGHAEELGRVRKWHKSKSRYSHSWGYKWCELFTQYAFVCLGMRALRHRFVVRVVWGETSESRTAHSCAGVRLQHTPFHSFSASFPY